jgi:hypothetical protein
MISFRRYHPPGAAAAAIFLFDSGCRADRSNGCDEDLLVVEEMSELKTLRDNRDHLAAKGIAA